MAAATGSEMFIWGGDDGGGRIALGALYNPMTNSWRTMSSVGQPSPYGDASQSGTSGAVHVWTGSRVLIWGGTANSLPNYAGGAQYDPAADKWTAIATNTVTQPRHAAGHVWTGSKLVVWGGRSEDAGAFNDGMTYEPATDQWQRLPSPPSGAASGAQNTMVWTGRVAIAWGGSLGSIGRPYDSGNLLNTGVIVGTNGLPRVSAINDLTLYEGTSLGPTAFSVTDDETDSASLVVTASSSEPTILNNASLRLGGSGSDRTLSYDGQFNTVGVTRISIQVSDGNNVIEAGFNINVLPRTPVVRISPEGKAAATAGGTFTAQVSVLSGMPTFTYRWRRNGVPIPGATAATYTINKVLIGDAASYDCEVSNVYGTATSSPVELSIQSPTVIVVQPLSRSALINQEVQFRVQATGSGELGYQWFRNNMPIEGANESVLSLMTEATSSGSFKVAVSNQLGTVTSAPAELTVLLPPELTQLPEDVIVAAGDTALFNVVAEGSALSYQWRRNGVNLRGQTGNTLLLSKVQLANEGLYDVAVKNPFGQVLSPAARLRLTAALAIETHPQGLSLPLGKTAEFSVVANGPAPLSYQWLKDGKPLAGARAATLTFTVADASVAGLYSVVVSSGALKVTSDAALLRPPVEGNLVYRLTMTGNGYSSTTGSSLASSGLLVIDRAQPRAGFIRVVKNGSLESMWVNVEEGLGMHSTGPTGSSQSVVAKVVSRGEPEVEHLAMFWLRGADSLVSFSAAEKLYAPRTLTGIQNQLSNNNGTQLESLSVRAVLDVTLTTEARQAQESIEQTLDRLSADLQRRGVIREEREP